MPSRPIPHPGVMAAPMDMSDSEGSRGRTPSALSVSRSSLKIHKNSLRRAVTQPRPAPQVYKTEPSDFRSLVQQLTGTSPPADSSPILTPKPLNPRLQKFAPPPLRPVFSYPSHPQQQQQQHAPPPQQQAPPQQQQQLAPLAGFNPGPRRYSLTPPRPSNFAVSPLSFSPLPTLSPADQIWANIMAPLESPGSLAMRQLSQMMDASKQGLQPQGMQQQQPPPPPPQQQQQPPAQAMHLPQTLAHSNFPNFPHEFSRFSGAASPALRFSPSTFNPTLNSTANSSFNSSFNSTLNSALTASSNSTGFRNPGFGNSAGMPSSGYDVFSQFSPSASLAMDNPFSFPDAGDASRSAFS